MTAWEITDLVAAQGGRQVLNGVSLTVSAGEVVGVLGPNGAGKTTLLKAGLGLLPGRSGTVRLGGQALANLSPSDRARLAGYLPQERHVGWNIASASIVALGAPDLPNGEASALALDCLDRVGLAGFAGRGVLDLSGGERARVLLARLLATRAALLTADEPVAGLDPDAQLMVLERLRAEAARGAAVVVTLHDLTLAARACDRLIVLDGGRIAAEGAPRDALSARVLQDVFGLDGALIDTPMGLVLAARRRG